MAVCAGSDACVEILLSHGAGMLLALETLVTFADPRRLTSGRSMLQAAVLLCEAPGQRSPEAAARFGIA